jgi:hypothetical protein
MPWLRVFRTNYSALIVYTNYALSRLKYQSVISESAILAVALASLL